MTRVHDEAPAAVAPPGSRSMHAHVTVAVAVVLGSVLIGMAVGYGAIALRGPQYRSTAVVVFTAIGGLGDMRAGSRFVQDRTDSWAAIASSDAVRNRAAAIGREPGNVPFDPGTVRVDAEEASGTESVDVTVTSAQEQAVSTEATYAARALTEVVAESERFPGRPESRVSGAVTSTGGLPVDSGSRDGAWWAVIGGIVGFVISLGACSALRPGAWARDVAPRPMGSRRQAVDLNARAMGDELQNLVRSLHWPQGRGAAIVTAVGLVGYGTTGLMVFPLGIVLAAGLWGWRHGDARWPVAALLFSGIGVFPEKVEIVKLGPVTPTVLEVALLSAMLVALRQRGTQPRPTFAAPVLGLAIAALVGAVVGLSRGGVLSLAVDELRAALLVLGYFPVFVAFARRPHQLVGVLLAVGGIASSVVIVASFAGWSNLLVDERTSVITGSSVAEVSRLSSPVLVLWAPLLIILLSALVPRRPRWLWITLVVVGVLHQALSFNRSTWVPLILLVVVVAAITRGPQGLVRRTLALLAVGIVTLTLAYGGVFGDQGRAIADRGTSLVTGQAYGEDSLPDRMRENGAALATLRESPWTGTGMGRPYGGELITYDSEHSRFVVDPRPYIHNQYLRIWLLMGVLGLFAYAFAGVRVASVVSCSWRRRAAGAPMVVVVSMGLACLAAQSILQTTLVERSSVLTIATLMAAASAFATWAPTWAPGPAPPGPVPSTDRRRPATVAGTLEG